MGAHGFDYGRSQMSGTSSNGTHFLIEFGSLHRTQMRKSGIKQPDLRWLPDTFCVGWGIGLWKEVESRGNG